MKFELGNLVGRGSLEANDENLGKTNAHTQIQARIRCYLNQRHAFKTIIRSAFQCNPNAARSIIICTLYIVYMHVQSFVKKFETPRKICIKPVFIPFSQNGRPESLYS
jgi:hypothetical protein